LSYRLTEDGETRLDAGRLSLKAGRTFIKGSLDRPGFLRLDLTLTTPTDTVRKSCACAYDPESIRATNRLPDDFHRFWRQARAELMRIPMDAVCGEAPEREDPNSKCYSVSLANIEGSRVYGWLRIPKGRGPFPAVLYIPGAGVGDVGTRQEYAAAGMAVLSIEVHGVPLGRDEQFYQNLRDGLLRDYKFFGSDDPYRFYYRRVILGIIRGIDYLCTRRDVDSLRVGIAGSSQGGALSLLVAGLDKRIKALSANVPAMCDHTGSLHGRPSGWPRLLANGDPELVLRTTGYYDAALNTALITAPALLAVGFVDRVCAPTTVYAAYNNIQGQKEIDHFPEMGHSFGPGWQDKAVSWMLKTLNRRAGKR
jgi:cephalosporin-C deacetylase-like acetyl esterase